MFSFASYYVRSLWQRRADYTRWEFAQLLFVLPIVLLFQSILVQRLLGGYWAEIVAFDRPRWEIERFEVCTYWWPEGDTFDNESMRQYIYRG